jgi:hypothetical protein
MSISPELLTLAHERFLMDNPEVVALLKYITARHAGAVGMTLEEFQQSELERAIARQARDRGMTAEALLLSYLREPQPPRKRGG